MIRIDEIYYNVFAKGLQHKSDIALHWFDPFGSVDIKNLCNRPLLTQPRLRIIFWDQEPVYEDTSKKFFDQFNKIYHPDFGQKILITSERNSSSLWELCDTFGIETVDYFFHGWAALDWYRGYNHSFLSIPYQSRSLQHALFIPNNIIGGQRKHRLRLLAGLKQRDAVDNNLISFPAVCPYEKISAEQLADSLDVDISGINLPLVIDQDQNLAARSHSIDFWQHGQRCFCHVVTETAFDDRLHLTEKIFKPIVMQQPFILAGSRHGLAYLREYGFRTFDGIWDETYDCLADDQRLSAVADLCADISHWSQKQINDAHQQAQPVVEHNFRWFYGGFQDLLWNELTTMMDRWR